MAAGSSGLSLRMLQKLSNRFFITRHGQAVSNVQSIIVSDIKVGGSDYGLTDLGQKQAAQAAQTLQQLLSEEQDLSTRLFVVSSDFLRAKQTAEIIHSYLQVKQPIKYDQGLRERWFGSLDMKNVADAAPVRELDKTDPTSKKYDHESVTEVMLRMNRVVMQLDKESKGCIYVIVSHGDPLQLLHTAFLGINPGRYLDHPFITNCEVRELVAGVQV